MNTLTLAGIIISLITMNLSSHLIDFAFHDYRIAKKTDFKIESKFDCLFGIIISIILFIGATGIFGALSYHFIHNM